MEAQFAELAQNPDVIVATPGRLLHHLAEVSGFSLSGVEYCVFDEADRMFEMGFAEQVIMIEMKIDLYKKSDVCMMWDDDACWCCWNDSGECVCECNGYEACNMSAGARQFDVNI